MGGLFLGRGSVFVVLKQKGMVLLLRKRLKMEMRTSASLLTRALRACPRMLSGPAALWGLILLSALCTWPDETVRVGHGAWLVQVGVHLFSVL